MKDIRITLSQKAKGRFGISGHVGVGHVHSHSGFVQDDSAGFAVAAAILKRALPAADTVIGSAIANVTTGQILVETRGGGTGRATPRRGVTPAEADLLGQRGAGADAAYPQAAAVGVFGRLYGQGVTETAAAFECACALAALDTFVKDAPNNFHVMDEKLAGRLDTAACTVVDIEGIPVALMLLINATEGGIGPDEDYEGNTMWAGKGRIMKTVGLDSAPTVIIESKAFIPAFAAEVKTNQIFIRAQDGVDDMRLARALIGAAQRNRVPYRFGADAMPLAPGSLKKATAAFADKIIALAQELKTVDRALDKVRITADLARLVSEDAGGVTFMSNSVHDKVRSVGIMPRTGAVVSMIVPAAYKEHVKIPMLTPEDVCAYMTVILEGLLDYAKD